MNRSRLMSATLFCLSVSLAGGVPAKGDDDAASLAVNRFALDLMHRLSGREGNLFFSPASVALALDMTWSGAAGDTRREMGRVLRLDGCTLEDLGRLQADLRPSHDGYTLKIANRLWGREGEPFLPTFLDPLADLFCAPLETADFAGDPEAARRRINAWVADATEQRIPELLVRGTIDRETALVLTNAVYFLANWSEAFKEDLTRPEPFRLPDGGRVAADLMERTGPFAYRQDDQFQILEIPYRSGELGMVVLLPRDADDPDLGLAGLDWDDLARRLDGLARTPVRCRLPRFRIEDSFSLPRTLAAMGMPSAFDPRRADFSGMSTRPGLFITDVVHKAFIEVDEAGTEAAAATAVVIGRTSLDVTPQDPVLFQADHPFTFLIRHRQTGTILFAGRVVDPSN